MSWIGKDGVLPLVLSISIVCVCFPGSCHAATLASAQLNLLNSTSSTENGTTATASPVNSTDNYTMTSPSAIENNTSPLNIFTADYNTNVTGIPSNHTNNFTSDGGDYTTPYSNSTGDNTTPYSNSTSDYTTPYSNSTSDYTTPYSNSTDDYTTPYSNSTDDYTTPYSNSTDDYTTPYSNFTDDYTTPYSNSTDDYTNTSPMPQSTPTTGSNPGAGKKNEKSSGVSDTTKWALVGTGIGLAVFLTIAGLIFYKHRLNRNSRLHSFINDKDL